MFWGTTTTNSVKTMDRNRANGSLNAKVGACLGRGGERASPGGSRDPMDQKEANKRNYTVSNMFHIMVDLFIKSYLNIYFTLTLLYVLIYSYFIVFFLCFFQPCSESTVEDWQFRPPVDQG